MIKVGNLVRMNNWLPGVWYEVVTVEVDGVDRYGDSTYKVEIDTHDSVGIIRYNKTSPHQWVVKGSVDGDEIITCSREEMRDQIVWEEEKEEEGIMDVTRRMFG